jgi:phosphatidylinositol alpha-1,6-mannosyltransferase
MVEAMPEIRNRIPQARLRVIGDGPELAALKEMAREKQVEDSIEFLGFIEDDAKAASLVSEGVAAVAPYIRDGSTYKRFADPGKVKIYLAAGLPVVICRVPPVAGLVESSGAGIAVEPSARIIAESVVDLLSSPEKMRAMSERALELGKSFDWTGIFDRAFEQTFTCWEG